MPRSASIYISGTPGSPLHWCTLQVAAAKLPDGTYEFICVSCIFEGASSEERFFALGPSARVSLTDVTIKCLAMVKDEAELERAQSLLGLGATPMQACTGRLSAGPKSQWCACLHLDAQHSWLPAACCRLHWQDRVWARSGDGCGYNMAVRHVRQPQATVTVPLSGHRVSCVSAACRA